MLQVSEEEWRAKYESMKSALPTYKKMKKELGDTEVGVGDNQIVCQVRVHEVCSADVQEEGRGGGRVCPKLYEFCSGAA